jgi:hypothetical protein
MVILFGALTLGTQFFHWGEIVRDLTDPLDEG